VDVAIRGDRASCLSLQLGPRTWLFAVARGFGAVDGVGTAPATLARVRSECERRVKGERFRRALDRPQAAATAMLGVLSRVNGALFARSAAHDDYVTAGCSLTAALIVRGHAYVIHTGGTAAYLAHKGEVSALTGDDALDDASRSVLARALGTTSSLDVGVSSVAVDSGDVMILMGHRVRGDVDRRALIAHVEEAGTNEHMLVIRFDDSDRALDELTTPLRPLVAYPLSWGVRILLGSCALLSSFILATAWAR
jgi:serine/threonine protein phosphatase PrpC